MPDIVQQLGRLTRKHGLLLGLTLFLALGCEQGAVNGGVETPASPVAQELAAVADSAPHSAVEKLEPASVLRVRADDLVATLADTLEQGRLSTAQSLRAARLDAVVDDILSMDGYQLHDVAADALLREVYRRAEADTAGQGERVLAYLYKEAELQFGTVKTDPALATVRAIAAQLPSNFDPRTFRFASAEQALAVGVSPALERAVQQLAYVYAQPNLSQLRGLALKHFRKPGFSFDRVVAESANTRDAIVRLFEQGTPPPRAEVAGEAIMRETLDFSGALRGQKEFLASIEDLRSELRLERLDDRLKSYAAHEDEIPSRRAQIEQADSESLLGKIARPDTRGVLLAAQRARSDTDRPTPARQKSAQDFSDYVTVSIERPPDEAPPPPGPTAGGGGGGGAGSGSGAPAAGERSGRPAWDASKRYRTGPPSSSYRARSAGPPPVSSSYRVAIRSARAGRGVSVGGPVTDPAHAQPAAAAWMVNREDGRFGRLVVRIAPEGGGAPYLAVSRTLFEDSFYAASSVIAGGHIGSTAFREGHILVVMSMDPFADPVPEAAELQRRAEDLRQRAESLGEDDYLGQLALVREALELRTAAGQLPRRVVVHPALFGRELAWSTVRADFWLNHRDDLSSEAAIINGGKAMPEALAKVDLTGATTWQFFERDAEIDLSSKGRVRSLSVRSTGPGSLAPSAKSHFALSMFGQEEDDDSAGEAEPPRLAELEVQLQPMLDWLAGNHHDFMRLNDFSESLTLLRWCRKHGVVPLLIDMDGEAPEIATPDRIVIGEGPRIK